MTSLFTRQLCHTISAIFLFLLSTGIQSQTLTQSFNEPVIGDVDKNLRMDTSAYTSGLPISVTGSNCVWNFSNLAGTYPFVVDSFVTPSAAPGATNYPAATYVQHRDVLYSYYKSTASPQQTELLGGYSSFLTLTFTNTAVIASYPVSYGYNFSDPVSGSFKYNNTTGACVGNITITADGLGTVLFPGSTPVPISNVIRLKSVETLTLSAGILPVGTFNQTIYNYYRPGKKFPILSINYTTYQLLAGTPTITALVYGSNDYFTVAGFNEVKHDEQLYQAFPNPFHDQLSLNAVQAAEDNTYVFYDMNGRLILSTKTLNDENIKTFLNGMYVLEIRNKRGSFRQALIKE